MDNLKVEEKPKQKSKLELQIEAALKKKAEEEGSAAVAGGEEVKKSKKKVTLPEVPQAEEIIAEPAAANEEEHVVYGAPDDKVWSDKSHAQMSEDSKLDEMDDVRFCLFLC